MIRETTKEIVAYGSSGHPLAECLRNFASTLIDDQYNQALVVEAVNRLNELESR
jgi:hypothetical protein